MPQMWLPRYLREQSHGYSFSTTSVPPTTLLELPFTPQLWKSSSTDLGTNSVVLVVDCVVETTPLSPLMMTKLSPLAAASEPSEGDWVVVVVVVDPGNRDGSIAAPIAPMAIPTGNAIASSWRVSVLLLKLSTSLSNPKDWIKYTTEEKSLLDKLNSQQQ